ncbi:MAG: PilZ domain-containing protein [Proteobacteria bacterium]|nr:PilZ domain-containing protein [Pseudomonadota bacterium]
MDKSHDDRGRDRRNSLRIWYRKDERPVITIGNVDYQITDLSENGFQMIYTPPIACGETVDGVIHLVGGSKTSVHGKAVWTSNDRTGVKLNTPLPRRLIIQEHKTCVEKKYASG